MVTYAQLQAEQWWAREVVTPELIQFGIWVRTSFGLPVDAIGNKGNNAHLNGSHRSQEWIEKSRYCTNHTYTVQQGLTAEQKRHIAGCDITPKTRADMLAVSQRIDRAARGGQLEEVVFWYGNTNGDQRVDGWDNIHNAVATSDDSHLWHLHLSFDRRVLRDLAVMRRVHAVLTGTTPESATTEDDMQLGDTFTIPNWDSDPRLQTSEKTSVQTALSVAQQRSYQAKLNTDLILAQLKANAAADEVRDKALQAAVDGITSNGGPDSAPIVAAVKKVGDDAQAQFTALHARIAELEAELEQARHAQHDAAQAEADATADKG